jgi:hypothetical protein
MTKKKNSLQGPGFCQLSVSTPACANERRNSFDESFLLLYSSFDFFKKNSNN